MGKSGHFMGDLSGLTVRRVPRPGRPALQARWDDDAKRLVIINGISPRTIVDVEAVELREGVTVWGGLSGEGEAVREDDPLYGGRALGGDQHVACVQRTVRRLHGEQTARVVGRCRSRPSVLHAAGLGWSGGDGERCTFYSSAFPLGREEVFVT